MIQAIGSSPGQTALPGGSDTGGLQAQLAQAERQLADCITCATANTPSGKAKIQVLTARVQALKDRLEEVATSKRAQPVNAEEAARFQGPGQGVAAPLAPTSGASFPGSLGGGLDVTA